MAILVATKGFLIPAATSVAWEALSNVGFWKRWDRSIHQVELLESPKPGALGRIAFKANANRVLKFTEVESRRRLQWEYEGALGTWIHQCALIENAEGAIVTFEKSFRGSCESLVCRLTEKRAARGLEEQGMRFASVCREILMNREIQQHIAEEIAKPA